jgi:hypothetical protein
MANDKGLVPNAMVQSFDEQPRNRLCDFILVLALRKQLTKWSGGFLRIEQKLANSHSTTLPLSHGCGCLHRAS